LRLFNPDCYAVITTESERIDLSPVSDSTGRRLDMSFNIFSTKDSQPNDGECTIYNLSETTRNKITEGGKIEVFAGYDGFFALIAVGDINLVNSRKPGTDWTTNIKWGDGAKQYLTASFTKSYREGVSIRDVLNDLTSSLGLASKGVLDKLKGSLDGGLSIDGKTKDLLNKITKDYGLEWSIQDDEVVIVSQGEPVDNEVIKVSQETGLLEFPQISEKGVDFVSQLNPEIRPNKLVDIQSSNFVKSKTKPTEQLPAQANGLNIVETVRFVGDNFGGQFSSQVKCRSYDR
jgi:hypothetical protein